MSHDISSNRVEELIALYKEKRRLVLNPDNITEWECFDFLNKPDEFDTIEEFLEHDENTELDERQQISLQLYDEIIADLEKLLQRDQNETTT